MKSFAQFITEGPAAPKFGKIEGTDLYRKPSTVAEVEQWAESHPQKKSYTVFDVIELKGKQWKDFSKKPLQDWPFLKNSNEYLQKLLDAGLLSRNAVPVVIVMCSDETSEEWPAGVIVDTQGSNYARYIALPVEDGEASLYMNPPITPSQKDVEAYLQSLDQLPDHLL